VHVGHTAEIGSFMLVSEASVSAGIRRVEAVTGRGAVDYVQHGLGSLGQIASALSTSPDAAAERVNALQSEIAALRKHIAALQRDVARSRFDALLASTTTIDGAQVLVARFDDAPADTLRDMTDWFRGAVKTGVMVLGGVSAGKPALVAAVTDDLTRRGVHAGNLIKSIAALIGGSGGGRPNMAQAGGKDAAAIPAALEAARGLIAEQLRG
jgi:alanyl-tRNA synthetase